MKWIEVATKEIGVKEKAGSGSNPRVIEYHSATSLKASDDAVPWCSAFVNWVFKQIDLAGTNSARARSWLQWGRAIDYRPGAVVILKRGNDPSQGHVGFAVDKKLFMVKVLGGNQSDQVCFAWYPTYKVLGYRWPLVLSKDA